MLLQKYHTVEHVKFEENDCPEFSTPFFLSSMSYLKSAVTTTVFDP